MTESQEKLLEEITSTFAGVNNVESIVLGGSYGAGSAKEGSDFDIYVYANGEVPTEVRRSLAERMTEGRIEIDNRFWEVGDEWTGKDSGTGVDIMYRTPDWLEDRLKAVLERHEAGMGYTTCFWFNVLLSRVLFDRNGWYEKTQTWAKQPYPDELKRNIIRKNWPLLSDNQSSYRAQIKKALSRDDSVSVNHRIAEYLASVFDILFAVNELPHPGEKRLLEWGAQCGNIPEGFLQAVDALVRLEGSLLDHVDVINSGIRKLWK